MSDPTTWDAATLLAEVEKIVATLPPDFDWEHDQIPMPPWLAAACEQITGIYETSD